MVPAERTWDQRLGIPYPGKDLGSEAWVLPQKELGTSELEYTHVGVDREVAVGGKN